MRIWGAGTGIRKEDGSLKEEKMKCEQWMKDVKGTLRRRMEPTRKNEMRTSEMEATLVGSVGYNISNSRLRSRASHHGPVARRLWTCQPLVRNERGT